MHRLTDIRHRIRTGDVFLFHGPSLESEIIEWVDGTAYSHVALGVRLPHFDRPLLWSSDEVRSITDVLDAGKRAGVHLVDAESMFRLCAQQRGKDGARYRFFWRALEVERTALFDARMERFMRSVDGRAFPSLMQLAWHFSEGKLFDIRANQRTFYCSELAADTYIHLGLLPKRTVDNRFSPGDFSSAHHLPLQQGARLKKEVEFVTD